MVLLWSALDTRRVLSHHLHISLATTRCGRASRRWSRPELINEAVQHLYREVLQHRRKSKYIIEACNMRVLVVCNSYTLYMGVRV